MLPWCVLLQLLISVTLFSCGESGELRVVRRGHGQLHIIGCVIRLAREGASVLATDISSQALEELDEIAKQENIKLQVRKLDVTCKEDIENLAKSLEKLDVLFNCAG